MLYEGNVLACIQIVDGVSIATSTNFTIHILIDPNDESSFIASDDYTEFQKAVIQLASVETQARKQLADQKLEFENMQLAFIDIRRITIENQNIVEEAKQIAENALGTATEALETIGTIPATATATTIVDYVDEKTSAGVAALNADLDATLAATDTDTEAIAVITGITEVEGVLTAVDSVAADKAGAATRAKAALIGQSGDAATVDTIYGAKAYADAAVADLDADVDAATDATVTDAEKVAVVTGVTEVDGIITGVDSIDVDRAGAATRAKAAVIGSASDNKDAATVYGAKAYADSVVGSAVADLDADLDASGTAQHAGVFVVSGVTQVDGELTSVDSTEVEVAGAAAAAEQAAKNYADSLLV